ncbi:MAG: hypothetical protein LBW85_03365 [Deltaproteobacteria bacterium]|jgi:formamidopyrimidine-DNA glycosylase|nr:hypothetical protein [Deltaproteobacteria bacterium]
MPELPEAETIARDLDSALKGAKVLRAAALFPAIAPGPLPLTALEGRAATGARRRGKCVLIGFEGGITLLASLRMTGQFLFGRAADFFGTPSLPDGGRGRVSAGRGKALEAGTDQVAAEPEKGWTFRKAGEAGSPRKAQETCNAGAALQGGEPGTAGPASGGSAPGKAGRSGLERPAATLPRGGGGPGRQSAPEGSDPAPDLREFPVPHVRAAFALSGGSLPDGLDALLYRDIRKFGRLSVAPDPEIEALMPAGASGEDALGISAEGFRRRLASSRSPVKAALMDQASLAGLGNIYATEALFEAGISPFRPATGLAPAEADRLWEAMRSILGEAIRLRGSTVENYRSPLGPGSYQDLHRAYGKAGLPCPRCGRPLERATVAGRGTVFCPACQK